MNCQRKLCYASAEFRPVVTIWPEWHPDYKGPPATAWISLWVCAQHATESAAQEILASGFGALREIVRAAGKADLDPERTTIRWERIQ